MAGQAICNTMSSYISARELPSNIYESYLIVSHNIIMFANSSVQANPYFLDTLRQNETMIAWCEGDQHNESDTTGAPSCTVMKIPVCIPL